MSKSWMDKEIKNNLKKVKTIDADKVDKFKTKEEFDIDYIDISKIVKNKLNFYPIINIDELAQDIKENGLSHNLVVRPLDDKYEIISGERRFTALTRLQQEGIEKYKKIPCKVVEVDDIQAMIMLIQSNAQSRDLTERIKLAQVKILNSLYEEKKKNKTMLTKEIQEEIAKSLNMSVSQIQKYEVISKASEKIQEAFEKKELTFREASSLGRLSILGQEIAIEIIKTTNKEVDIEKLKKEIQIIEKEHKKNNSSEEDLKKSLELLKDKYIKIYNNEDNDIKDELINKATNKLVKKQIKQVNKKAKDIINNINNLVDIDKNLLIEINELEKIILQIKTKINTK